MKIDQAKQIDLKDKNEEAKESAKAPNKLKSLVTYTSDSENSD